MDDLQPEPEIIRVILTTLGIHKAAAMYETFPAPKPGTLSKRFASILRPKHGSWLNMPVVEWGAYQQTLAEFIPDNPKPAHAVQAPARERNNERVAIDWQFQTDEVRINLNLPRPSPID